MSRLNDFLAGVMGCTTDIQCEQLSVVAGVYTATIILGSLIAAIGMLNLWVARKLRER